MVRTQGDMGTGMVWLGIEDMAGTVRTWGVGDGRGMGMGAQGGQGGVDMGTVGETADQETAQGQGQQDSGGHQGTAGSGMMSDSMTRWGDSNVTQ